MNSKMEVCLSQNCKTSTLVTQRYFIPCSKALSTQNCGININELVNEVCEKNKYKLIQDDTLVPVLNKRSASTPTVRQIDWSPVDSRHKLRCVLAILTSSGAFDIHYLRRGTWVCGVSIAEKWHDYCFQKWESIPKNVNDILEELETRTSKKKFSAFSWGVCRQKSFYEIFAGTVDGTLTVWEFGQDTDTKEIQIKLLEEFQTRGKHITSLHCQYIPVLDKYIVFLAFNNGKISYISVDFNDNDITIGSEHELWDEEDKLHIEPRGLYSNVNFENDELGMVLYAIKGSFILIYRINLNSQTPSHKITIVNTEQSAITGFVCLSQTQSLVIGQSGTISLLVMKDFEPTISKLQESLRTSHYACNGIALSRSKTIAVLPFSVKTNYDHLAMKDLCNILWCSVFDIDHTRAIISNHLGPLSSIWDALEVVRIESILKSSSVAWNLTSEELDTMEIGDLKKNLALLQIALVTERNFEAREEKMNIESEMQELIISCHIFKRISYLMIETTLKDFEIKSLSIMYLWLDYILEKYSSKYKYTTTTATTLKEQLCSVVKNFKKEKCFICKSDILLIQYNY